MMFACISGKIYFYFGPVQQTDHFVQRFLIQEREKIAEVLQKALDANTNPSRGMNMLYDGLKEKGSMVIVPSFAQDSMNLGVIGGLVSLAKTNDLKKQ